MKRAGIKYTLYLLLIVIAMACNNNSNTTRPATDTLEKTPAAVADSSKIIVPIVTENDIIDTLTALPFVKESNQLIDSVSHHKHGMAFIIDTADKAYHVRAGYDREDRFETFYTFSVDKKTRAIKVLDVISDEMITPAEFEKRRAAHQ